MFKKITTLFQSLTAKESEKPDPERLSYLAATALMIELSRADNSIDQQEIQTIIAIATDTFGLSDDEAADILSEAKLKNCLLYTSPSPRDATLSRMPSSA